MSEIILGIFIGYLLVGLILLAVWFRNYLRVRSKLKYKSHTGYASMGEGASYCNPHAVVKVRRLHKDV